MEAPLSPRLRLICSFVRPGRTAADIGTDHAYVAAELVGTGKTPFCIACDIRPGPLSRAEETVRRCHAENRIELRLSDGLDALRPMEAEEIIIAGMGGEQIAKIVGRCNWLRNEDVRLVLQPMTAQAELRKSLCGYGFEITKEAVAGEGEKLYLVMAAKYSGKQFTPEAFFCLAGLLPHNGDELSRRYLLKQADVLIKAARGMRKSKTPRDTSGMELLARRLADSARPGNPADRERMS